MSGINYTVFVNPSGVARNIFILSSTEAGVTGKKWARRQRASGLLNYSQDVQPARTRRRRTFTVYQAVRKEPGLAGGKRYYRIICQRNKLSNFLVFRITSSQRERERERRDILLAATLAPRIISLHERVYPTRTRSNREKKHSESLLHRFCCA